MGSDGLAGSAVTDILGGEEEGFLGEHGSPFCHAGPHHLLLPRQVSALQLPLLDPLCNVSDSMLRKPCKEFQTLNWPHIIARLLLRFAILNKNQIPPFVPGCSASNRPASDFCGGPAMIEHVFVFRCAASQRWGRWCSCATTSTTSSWRAPRWRDMQSTSGCPQRCLWSSCYPGSHRASTTSPSMSYAPSTMSPSMCARLSVFPLSSAQFLGIFQ